MLALRFDVATAFSWVWGAALIPVDQHSWIEEIQHLCAFYPLRMSTNTFCGSVLYEEAAHFLPGWFCLRVQPPSWKLKNPRAQRSHLGPVTPGWHRHWPISSQSNDLEPKELQWHGAHTPRALRPWVWDCKDKENSACKQEAEKRAGRTHAVGIPRQN